MPRPRITFDVPLTVPHYSRLPVYGRIGPARIDAQSRLDGVRDAIELMARDVNSMRCLRQPVERAQLRYVISLLRSAWTFAVEDARLGFLRIEGAELRGSDGGGAKFELHTAEEALSKLKFSLALDGQKLWLEAGERHAKALATEHARKAKARYRKHDKDDALRRAAELRKKNRALSDRSIAELLARETGKPTSTIRRWLGEARKN